MNTSAQLRNALHAQNLPPPNSDFLAHLTSRSPPPPLPSLLATAKARILACDLTNVSILSELHPLPDGLDDANAKETRLPYDVYLQVVDVENLTLSRWEQIEELEADERGERTRGRQVIRVTAETEENDGGAIAGKNATHRLVLQDCNGRRVYGVEMARMNGLGLSTTNIGCKVLLRKDAVVARGTVLLSDENCVLLGGKIDSWHETWLKGRIARLKESVGRELEA